MRKYNVLLYLLPLIENILMLPLYVCCEVWWKISIIQIITNTIIIPLYMVFVLSAIIKKFNIGRLILSLFIILVCIILHYINWGIHTGYLLNPDSETIYILKCEIIISFFIVIVGYYYKKTYTIKMIMSRLIHEADISCLMNIHTMRTDCVHQRP